ncbi:TonB-dependent receptor domain-containing protein [Kordiimonas sp. SCSIO 12610]|uniref:TonB-dependent receptor family protein n=1 Tax=Kordiimonas sp. SCSIO 12610 TaxID=2829597 RepID=UPI00210E6248|nr:TonB-dependent receptor [Kordiimonas sp. SCSIO 12610]UTW56293.1 TonB-dependent receptor [Kordiimonas sp. SCSIO 12610]
MFKFATALFGSMATMIATNPAFAIDADVEAIADPLGDDIETILVTDEHRTAALQNALEFARAQAGNVTIVAREEFAGRYAVSFRDTLAFTPGIVSAPRYGEESRLSIRGSGLAQNFHLRGIELLFDGVPINAADGFGDFQEIDPSFTSHITVNRGANAFRTGSTTLGGSIELTGINAESVSSRYALALEGGSFGTTRLTAHAAEDFGKLDILGAISWQRQDGFRNHSDQNNFRAYTNIGYEWSDSVKTRFGGILNVVNQDIPGAVSLDSALNTPELANPQAVANDFARDINSVRLFTTTTVDVTPEDTIEFGGAYTARELIHPIPIFIDNDVDDYTAFVRYEGERDANGIPINWTLGARYRNGHNFSVISLNFGGDRGPVIGDTTQHAETFEAYGELRGEIFDGFTIVGGLTYITTDRDLEDNLNPARNPEADFDQASPKIGILYEVTPNVQLFANLSASYEPPTFLDLTQGGQPLFVPLEAQDGTTFEIGTRGSIENFQFEIAYYNAQLENEFIAFTEDALLPAPIFNAADETTHEGIEASVLARFEATEDLIIAPRVSYTYQDFTFDNDPVFGNNRLAGAPRHSGRIELAFEWQDFRIAPNLQFQTDTFVDFANTLELPDFTVFGVEASYRVNDTITLYLDARNLEDQGFVTESATIANASTATNLNIFTPGNGLSVFGSVRIGFGGNP